MIRISNNTYFILCFIIFLIAIYFTIYFLQCEINIWHTYREGLDVDKEKDKMNAQIEKLNIANQGITSTTDFMTTDISGTMDNINALNDDISVILNTKQNQEFANIVVDDDIKTLDTDIYNARRVLSSQ